MVAGSDGFHAAFIFDVPPENGITIDVIPAGHIASLVEMHRPEQIQQVRALLTQAAIAGKDIGIIDANSMPHGRFSTQGFLSLLEEFDACVAGQRE